MWRYYQDYVFTGCPENALYPDVYIVIEILNGLYIGIEEIELHLHLGHLADTFIQSDLQ